MFLQYQAIVCIIRWSERKNRINLLSLLITHLSRRMSRLLKLTSHFNICIISSQQQSRYIFWRSLSGLGNHLQISFAVWRFEVSIREDLRPNLHSFYEKTANFTENELWIKFFKNYKDLNLMYITSYLWMHKTFHSWFFLNLFA